MYEKQVQAHIVHPHPVKLHPGPRHIGTGFRPLHNSVPRKCPLGLVHAVLSVSKLLNLMNQEAHVNVRSASPGSACKGFCISRKFSKALSAATRFK